MNAIKMPVYTNKSVKKSKVYKKDWPYYWYVKLYNNQLLK